MPSIQEVCKPMIRRLLTKKSSVEADCVGWVDVRETQPNAGSVKRILVLFLVIGMLFGGTGCNRVGSEIPQSAVIEAVTLQAQEKQIALWQQLASTGETAPALRVKKVKIRDVHRVRVIDDLAYEVTGTYESTLRYPKRSPIQQSQIPFSLILQEQEENGTWQLLQQTSASDLPWYWQALQNAA